MPPKKDEDEKEPEIDPMTVLSDDTLRKYREVFSSFDEAGEGFIARSDLGLALKALGVIPSEAELKVLGDKYASSGKFDFVAFVKAIYKLSNAPNSRDAMIRAFRVFDPRGLGVVTQAEFRAIFQSIGGDDARLDPLIVDDLVDYADEVQAGQVRYEEFVQRIYNDFEEHQRKKAAEASGKK